MPKWPDTRLQDLLQIELPILLSPMAGSGGVDLAVAVANAGGLGAYPCAYVPSEKIREDVAKLRSGTNRPFNMNFFCHEEPALDQGRQEAWRRKLSPYYEEFDADLPPPLEAIRPSSFNEDLCVLVEELKPHIVSFHFGLPPEPLLDRVRTTGCKILSSATTVSEAVWLAERGVDVIIAQGVEAGGHRGMFLSGKIASQVGTLALVPQIVDAVNVPVVAAGGVADGRGIAAAFALGASGVQIGTAYLRCPEALTSLVHRDALVSAKDDSSVLTNVFSGRPARSVVNRLVREQGPMSDDTPVFPLATRELGPLRVASQQKSDGSFTPLWTGQAGPLASETAAGDLTQQLAESALNIMKNLSS